MKTLTERTTAALAWIDSQLVICNAATDGPWIHDTSRGTIGDVITADFDAIAQAQQRIDAAGHGNKRQTEMRNKNAAFIATARTGYPAVLDGMTFAIRCLQLMAIREPDDSKAKIAAHFTLSEILTKIESLQ